MHASCSKPSMSLHTASLMALAEYGGLSFQVSNMRKKSQTFWLAVNPEYQVQRLLTTDFAAHDVYLTIPSLLVLTSHARASLVLAGSYM